MTNNNPYAFTDPMLTAFIAGPSSPVPMYQPLDCPPGYGTLEPYSHLDCTFEVDEDFGIAGLPAFVVPTAALGADATVTCTSPTVPVVY